MQPSALLSFVSLTKRIGGRLHGQLPLNPREAQQLLNVLTTSFQRHLDDHHPTAKTAGVPKASVPEPAISSSPKSAPAASSTSAFESANAHISLLLSSPLLRPRAIATNQPLFTPDVRKDAIGWLSAHWGDGQRKTRVKECFQEIWASPCYAPRAAATTTLEVAHWAMAHGKMKIGQLMSDNVIAKYLIKSGIKLGRFDQITSWCGTVLRQNVNLGGELLNRYFSILIGVASKHQEASLLRIALETFIFESRSHPQRPVLEPFPILAAILRESQLVKELPARLYDCFAVAVSEASSDGAYPHAIIQLSHPSDPSSDAALHYIQNGAMGRDLALHTEIPFRRVCVRFCLVLTQKLLLENNTTDADNILQFAYTTFPLELAVRPEKSDPKLEEASNILRLDRFEMGAVT